jgi:hypothetical protein
LLREDDPSALEGVGNTAQAEAPSGVSAKLLKKILVQLLEI